MEAILLYDMSRYVSIKFKYYRLFRITKRIYKIYDNTDMDLTAFKILKEKNKKLFSKIVKCINSDEIFDIYDSLNLRLMCPRVIEQIPDYGCQCIICGMVTCRGCVPNDHITCCRCEWFITCQDKKNYICDDCK